MGLPCLISRSKKDIFFFVKDRVWKKINGWKEKVLSQGGKEVLINNVVQAIPTYVMSCFLLLSNIINSLNSMVRQFFRRGEGVLKGTKECVGKPGEIHINLNI